MDMNICVSLASQKGESSKLGLQVGHEYQNVEHAHHVIVHVF
jgi:hypothetical protein